MQSPRSIVITGASSGIGEYLAKAYAAPGMTLAITGRNAERLAEVAESCRSRGASVIAKALDVADQAAMETWLLECDETCPVDLIIANAGISTGMGSIEQLDTTTRAIFDANVTGVFNTIHPLTPRMAQRRRGQIAIVASLAGFRGLPGAAAYSASKAAVRVYGEGLRGQLARKGIEVNVICPGYVKSRMTARNKYPMPFLQDTDASADYIKRKLAANTGRIAFPWPMYGLVWLMAAMPDWLSNRLTSRLPEKE